MIFVVCCFFFSPMNWFSATCRVCCHDFSLCAVSFFLPMFFAVCLLWALKVWAKSVPAPGLRQHFGGQGGEAICFCLFLAPLRPVWAKYNNHRAGDIA